MRRVAASSTGISGVRLAVALSLAAHSLVAGAALAVVALLHALTGVALVWLAVAAHVHLLLLAWAHKLALPRVALLGVAAVVRLLVVILVVRVRHSNRWWLRGK